MILKDGVWQVRLRLTVRWQTFPVRVLPAMRVLIGLLSLPFAWEIDTTNLQTRHTPHRSTILVEVLQVLL